MSNQPDHNEEVLEMVTDTNQERGLKQMSKEEKYAVVIQENVQKVSVKHEN